MARQKRLNIPGAIYHVITRGINGSETVKCFGIKKPSLDKSIIIGEKLVKERVLKLIS